MKQFLKVAIAFSFLSLMGICCLLSNKAIAAQAPKVYSIHQINKQKPMGGVFVTQGYIAKIYTAPACPPGAQCKPSMADNIVISEDKKNLDSYNLSAREMILFTSKTAELKKGKRYRFQIEITDQKTTNESLNDVVLLHFRALD